MKIIDMNESINKTGSAELSLQLYQLLYESLPEDHAALIQALTHNQYDIARKIIHKINGGLCYCIAPHYARSLFLLQQSVHQQDPVDISAVQSAYESLIQALKELL